MPRNAEKDMQETARRRKRILEAGLALFSRHGIESVSMNAVAAAAGVGATTLFKYYRTKEKLVIAISGMAWKAVWEESIAAGGQARFAALSAYEMIVSYTETMIRLYRERPRLLCFSSNYKTFICRSRTDSAALREHLDPLEPIRAVFHGAYLRAKKDHSIRTDIPEDVLFTSVALGMLAIAERYAQGIVWADRGGPDHLLELRITQQMILNWCREGTETPPADTGAMPPADAGQTGESAIWNENEH